MYIRETPGCKIGHNRVEVGNAEDTAEEESEEFEHLELEGDDLIQTPSEKKPAKSAAAKIPSRYNTETELEADVQPGENFFDFSLTSEPYSLRNAERHAR